MNLLGIVQKIWRYRVVTMPIVGLVVLGAFYVVVIKDPVYEASASFILVNPPPPPTEEQIRRDPELGEVDSDNPYTRYSDQSVPVQVLAARLDSEGARDDLAKRGADRDYTVASSVKFGLTAPIVEITGTGSSPRAAVATANVVGAELTRELDQMQEERGVADDYKIVTQPVVLPQDAQLQASGTLRTLIGVLALGCVLLFVVVTAADAFEELRRRRDWEYGWGLAGDAEDDTPQAQPARLNSEAAEDAPLRHQGSSGRYERRRAR